MARTTIFKNNQTQSVRLSKDVAFPESVKEVEVIALGTSRIISPAGTSWDHWFDHGATISDDFLAVRTQPVAEERDSL